MDKIANYSYPVGQYSGSANSLHRRLRRVARKCIEHLRIILLSFGTALAAPAQALESGPLIQGSYEIQTWFTDSVGIVYGTGCLTMMGGSPASLVPALYQWPSGGNHCGLDNPNAQAIWDIYPVVSGQTVRHVIKSRTNNQCLIRGSNGQAGNPSLYLWPDNADKRYCGLASADAFVANGQAAWDFTDFQPKVDEVGDIVYSGRISLASGGLHFRSLHIPPPGVDYSPAEFLTDTVITSRWSMNLWSTLAKPLPRKPL